MNVIELSTSVDFPERRRKRLSIWITLSVVTLMLAVSPRASEVTNVYCPVTTSELAEEQFWVDYEGSRVYFCCNNCKRDFLANPDQYMANLNVDSESPVDPSELTDADAHDHEHTNDKSESVSAYSDGESHDDGVEEAHDHATDHGSSISFVTVAGKFHPMVTHFPIALIISALLFSTATIWLKIDTFETVSVYLIYLAAVSGLLTVILGLAAGSSASYPSFLESYLDRHRILGLVTGVMTLVTAYLGYRRQRTGVSSIAYAYRTALFINAVLVGITGHFGSALVFGPDHFSF